MGMVQKWKRFRNGKGSEMGNGKLFRNKNGSEMATVQKFEVSEMGMVRKEYNQELGTMP